MEEPNPKLNELYAQLQGLDGHVKELQQRIQIVENQMEDLAGTREALSDLEKVKAGSEIIVPVANGIFAKASIGDVGTLLVNVGGSVTVPKPISEIVKIIETQAKEIEEGHGHLQEQLKALFERATELNEEISTLIT